MSPDILEIYENKEFFNLEDKRKKAIPEIPDELETDGLESHGVFNLPKPKAAPKGKFVPPPLIFDDEDKFQEERIYWMERIKDLTDALKGQVNSDATLSSIPNLYTEIVERYHSYAALFARKNAEFKANYAIQQEKLSYGDRKMTKGSLDLRTDGLLAFEKMKLEMLQSHMGYVDEMREAVKNIFYLVKHYERFRDNLSNTNLK